MSISLSSLMTLSVLGLEIPQKHQGFRLAWEVKKHPEDSNNKPLWYSYVENSMYAITRS